MPHNKLPVFALFKVYVRLQKMDLQTKHEILQNIVVRTTNGRLLSLLFCLEEKIKLIKEKENGLSHRHFSDKFNTSVGSVSNILKRKSEYLDDYQGNQNKKMKRKLRNKLEEVNLQVCEWFCLQRSKNIPISGPIIQQYARDLTCQLDPCTSFCASNGWLDRFCTRYNIQFRRICGESQSVDVTTVDEWKSRLDSIIEHYDPCNIFNCDKTSLVVNRDDCYGGKKSKDRYTVLLCSNMSEIEKLKPLVIGTLMLISLFSIIYFLFTSKVNTPNLGASAMSV